mmetsp:Transcript_84289/g.187160  ORF Transcript_84289/g.187160 Transcript_84289/m.187160 type:complete len:233 (+) Transcript_84289:1088-1786(+)
MPLELGANLLHLMPRLLQLVRRGEILLLPVLHAVAEDGVVVLHRSLHGLPLRLLSRLLRLRFELGQAALLGLHCDQQPPILLGDFDQPLLQFHRGISGTHSIASQHVEVASDLGEFGFSPRKLVLEKSALPAPLAIIHRIRTRRRHEPHPLDPLVLIVGAGPLSLRLANIEALGPRSLGALALKAGDVVILPVRSAAQIVADFKLRHGASRTRSRALTPVAPLRARTSLPDS